MTGNSSTFNMLKKMNYTQRWTNPHPHLLTKNQSEWMKLFTSGSKTNSAPKYATTLMRVVVSL